MNSKVRVVFTGFLAAILLAALHVSALWPRSSGMIPDTGDSSRPVLYVCIAAAALLILIILIILAKTRNRK